MPPGMGLVGATGEIASVAYDVLIQDILKARKPPEPGVFAEGSTGGAFPKKGNKDLIKLINRVFEYATHRGVTIVVSAGNEATTWVLPSSCAGSA